MSIIVISEYLGRGQWSKQARLRGKKAAKCSKNARICWRPDLNLIEHLSFATDKNEGTQNFCLKADTWNMPGPKGRQHTIQNYPNHLTLIHCNYPRIATAGGSSSSSSFSQWAQDFQKEGRYSSPTIISSLPYIIFSKSPAISQTLDQSCQGKACISWNIFLLLFNLDLWSSKLQ